MQRETSYPVPAALEVTQHVLRDGREMLIRPACEADLPTLLAEFCPEPPVGLPTQAAEVYGKLKTWLYITTPGACVLSAWIGTSLAGVVYFTEQPAAIRRRAYSFASLRMLARELLDRRVKGFGRLLVWAAMHSFRSAAGWARSLLRRLVAGTSTTRGYPPRTGIITHLFTVPTFRRLGVASCLLAQAEALLRARGARAVTLWVAPDNEGALRLYEGRGYTIYRRSPTTISVQLLMADSPEAAATATGVSCSGNQGPVQPEPARRRRK